MSNKSLNIFDVTERAMAHFGLETQVNKLIEELDELKKALIKGQECGFDLCSAHIAEELADVHILTLPVMKALNLEGQVPKWTQVKLKRLDKIIM